jgi:hypothetical protein
MSRRSRRARLARVVPPVPLKPGTFEACRTSSTFSVSHEANDDPKRRERQSYPRRFSMSTATLAGFAIIDASASVRPPSIEADRSRFDVAWLPSTAVETRFELQRRRPRLG